MYTCILLIFIYTHIDNFFNSYYLNSLNLIKIIMKPKKIVIHYKL